MDITDPLEWFKDMMSVLGQYMAGAGAYVPFESTNVWTKVCIHRFWFCSAH